MFDQTISPEQLEPLGAFALVVVVLVAVVVWLIRDRQRIIIDRDAERAATREISERLTEQAHRTIPVLERNTAALQDATRALERLERERDR